MAERVLLYLKGTATHGLRYRMDDKRTLPTSIEMRMFVDSSYANGRNRRSINGFALLLNNNLVHWKSRVSPMVCLSTTEAEFVSVAMSMKEIEWVYSMVSEFKIRIDVAVIYCDNQGAIKIFTSEAGFGRTKHLDIRLQFVKDLFKVGKYQIRYVRSDENLADLFTKPLQRLNFQRIVDKLMYSDKLENKGDY